MLCWSAVSMEGEDTHSSHSEIAHYGPHLLIEHPPCVCVPVPPGFWRVCLWPMSVIEYVTASHQSSFTSDAVTVTVQWFLKEEQPMVQAIWQAMLGVAGVLTNLFGVSSHKFVA